MVILPPGPLKVIQKHGSSVIYGCNGPGYPIRDFYYAMNREIDWPLEVLFSGYSETSPQCFRDRRKSDLYAISWICEGEKVVVVNGKTFDLGPQSVYLLHRGRDEILAPKTKVRKLCVAFEGNLVPSIMSQLGLDDFDPLVVPQEHQNAIFQSMLGIYETMKNWNVENRMQAASQLYGLLLHLGNLAQEGMVNELGPVLHMMQDRVRERLELSELARIGRMSVSKLQRLFLKHHGESPIEYFNQLKISSAKLLLRRSDMSVSSIADYLGYSSSIYFSGEFKKRVACSPRDYRKSYQIL